MGTNYYIESEPDCPTCGRPFEQMHIGKSSAGWCFSLHVIPELGLNGLEDWKKYWKGKTIRNEYGGEITEEQMVSIITERSWPDRKSSDSFKPYYTSMLEKNHVVEGPNGLLRHKIDGVHCIGHGEGTWDLITGEFS